MKYELVFLAAMTSFAAVLVRTERVLRRWEGAVLVLAYVTFPLGLLLRR